MMNKKLILCLWMTFSFAVAMTAANRKFVLVIDAGHGGHDAGALGYVSKEKDLTLRYALAFGAAVEKNCPDVKVIYTRKTDVFVELWRRAEIANQAKADLFVSVHINSVGKGRIARGYQTYTLGKGESGTAIDKNLIRRRVTSCSSSSKTTTWNAAWNCRSTCSATSAELQAVRTWAPTRKTWPCCACRPCRAV